MPKKRILHKFKITEISVVDAPAQKDAKVVLLKRDEEIQKGGDLLSVANGHQHLIITDSGEGEMSSGQTRWARDPKDDHEHAHPWVRKSDGEIVIGMANGHTHTLDDLIKGDIKMSKDELQKAIGKYIGGDKTQAEEIKKAAKELDMQNLLPAELVDNSRIETLAMMTDVQKAYYKTLGDEAKSDFLKMTDEVRDQEIAKANETPDDQTIIYKADDGTTFTKADDPRLVAMAKRNDEMARTNAKLKNKADDAEVEKRANELIPYLGGDDAGRVALLKSVEAIEDDEVRKSALQSLKTANTHASTAFTRIGTSDIGKSSEALSAEDELDQMAEEIAKRDNINHTVAYGKALTTDRGRKLYAQTVQN